jgi:hypothetical protein
MLVTPSWLPITVLRHRACSKPKMEQTCKTEQSYLNTSEGPQQREGPQHSGDSTYSLSSADPCLIPGHLCTLPNLPSRMFW